MSLAHVLGFGLAAYVADVVVRPQATAQRARAAAASRGKPVLNIGAGTPGSSARVAILGPTLWGDVNIDLAADRSIPDGPDRVSWGDACDLSRWPDKHFGAVVASHVLEHVDDPARALSEMHRVADEVYVLVPRWWAPHTWLHPGHQWFMRENPLGGFSAAPLWGRR